WCCADFFKNFTDKWNIKILTHAFFGKRYFVKFESYSPELSKNLSELKDKKSQNIYLSDNKHVGIGLEEEGKRCISKYSINYKEKCYIHNNKIFCNEPHLK